MGEAPTITIHLPGPLRAYCAGAEQLSISAHAVRDLDEVDTTLTPGDVVTILPAVSGG